MRCPSCQFDNESVARFCSNCGGAIQVINYPAVNQVGQTVCSHCGTQNTSNSMFCGNCGAQMGQQPVTGAFRTTAQTPTNKTSGAWWLLPFMFMWIGGYVAYLAVRENDKAKAKHLLVFGIVWTFVWIALYMILAYVGGLIAEI